MTNAVIQLGFQIGTGNPIGAPRHHTVVTGQTRSAGKTTLLEELISRFCQAAITRSVVSSPLRLHGSERPADSTRSKRLVRHVRV